MWAHFRGRKPRSTDVFWGIFRHPKNPDFDPFFGVPDPVPDPSLDPTPDPVPDPKMGKIPDLAKIGHFPDFWPKWGFMLIFQ